MQRDIIRVKFSHIEIPNYNIGDCPLLEYHFSRRDNRLFKDVVKGIMFEPEEKKVKICRATDLDFLENALNRNIVMEHEPDVKPKKIKLMMTKEPRDKLQREALTFLTGKGKYSYTARSSQLCLNTEPGTGKTVVGTMGICLFGVRTLIVTHQERIKTQWTDTLKDFTNIDEIQIVNIDGSDMVDKILGVSKYKTKSKQDTFEATIKNAKVFCVNHRTISTYANKNGWKSITALFIKLEIGLKIIDECHIEFDNMINIDLHTDVKHNLYLTATMGRSDATEMSLFKTCYSHMPTFKNPFKSEMRKHINYMGIFLNLQPKHGDLMNMKNFYGFQIQNYLRYVMTRPTYIDAIYNVTDLFVKNEGKILILCGLVDICNDLYERLQERYPDKTIGLYHGEVKGNKDLELEKDIIVSTFKSMGTGTDVHGLRFLLNLEPASSKVITTQVTGRLREYSPDLYSVYSEIIVKDINKVNEMYKRRKFVFNKVFNKLITVDLDKNV